VGTYAFSIRAENELGYIIQTFAIVVGEGTSKSGPIQLSFPARSTPLNNEKGKSGKTTTVFTNYTPKQRSTKEMQKIASKIKDKVITLDLDGSAYDPWACCKKADWSWIGTEECRHIRQDVLDEVRALAAETGASIVALSWRSGGDTPTRKWLKLVGLELDAIFIPGAPDDLCGFAGDHKDSYGQIGFKVATVVALRALGKDVIACFDDRTSVCRQLREIGVPNVHQVKHLVEPLPHEYTAGYIGAPRPSPSSYTHYGYGGTAGTGSRWWESGQGSLLERHDAAFHSGTSHSHGKSEKHDRPDSDFGALAIEDHTGMTQDEARARFERAMADVDPLDPLFDPNAEIEMSDITGDPDAPPQRLHEILDSDGFWAEDVEQQKRGSRRRDLQYPGTCVECGCGVDENGVYMHEDWCWLYKSVRG
jgi:hypothetical protein